MTTTTLNIKHISNRKTFYRYLNHKCSRCEISSSVRKYWMWSIILRDKKYFTHSLIERIMCFIRQAPLDRTTTMKNVDTIYIHVHVYLINEVVTSVKYNARFETPYKTVSNNFIIPVNKGNNKISEHRAIFQRKRQNSLINKQTKSVNNRETGKPAMAWLSTCISKEMVDWIRFYGAKPLAFITIQRIYYLCNQCISPQMLWARISIRASCTTLCDKVC